MLFGSHSNAKEILQHMNCICCFQNEKNAAIVKNIIMKIIRGIIVMEIQLNMFVVYVIQQNRCA